MKKSRKASLMTLVFQMLAAVMQNLSQVMSPRKTNKAVQTQKTLKVSKIDQILTKMFRKVV